MCDFLSFYLRRFNINNPHFQIKRLRKAVISDYEQAGGNADEAESLFNEKLEKAGVTVDGKIVQLA